MSLLNMNRANSRDLVKSLVSRTKKVSKSSAPTVAKGGSLITRIKNIEQLVQQRIGHYADQLELIQDVPTLHKYIDTAIENGDIAIDTETTGLDPILDQIVGVCIYTHKEKPAYIPINHISYVSNTRLQPQLTETEVAQELQRLVEAKTKIIMFNAKFDIRVIRHQLGVYMTPAWCGFIAGKCLKNNELEGNLKYLWKKYCSQNKDEAHFTFDKMFDGLKFNLIPLNTAYLYAAKDALMTMDLYEFQKPYLTVGDPKCEECGFQKLAKLYNEIELPIINVVADIEDTGVCIDEEYCKMLSKKYNDLLTEAQNKFYEELKNYKDQIVSYISTHPQTKLEDPINIASPQQLAELFYDVLQQPAVSKKSPRGTGEEVLEKMGHPLGKLILEYRGVAKLLNTYIDKMPAILNPKTKRIHCSFNQYGTDCIVGDSIVITKRGFKTIQELLKDTCTSPKKYFPLTVPILNRYNVWENTSKCIKYEKEATIKITTENGFEIQGTYNHPVLVKYRQFNGDHVGFKKLQNISNGDKIVVALNWNYPEITQNNLDLSQTYKLSQIFYKKYIHHKNKKLNLSQFAGDLSWGICNFLKVTHKDQIFAKLSTCNKRSLEYFYKGILDNIPKNVPEIKITSLSKQDIKFLQMTLTCFGVIGKVQKEYGKYNLILNKNNLQILKDYLNGIKQTYNNKNTDKVVKIEYGIANVYDLHIPLTHSFMSNGLTCHNTGRFSSNNPNLQNIPSHNKDIRPMFIGSTHTKVVSDENNVLELLWGDILETPQGNKFIMDLNVGDCILAEEGCYQITKIETEKNTYRIQVKSNLNI